VIDMLGLFIHPVALARWQQMLLLLPLCLCISIVYKTMRCADLRQLPAAALVSWITVVVGMYLVGIALLVMYELAMAYSF
jgi:hypothetical protein